MSRLPRALLRALLPLASYALAREVDRTVGLLLRSTLDLPSFVATALSLVDGREALFEMGQFVVVGWVALAALAGLRARSGALAFVDAFEEETQGLRPLYLRPALTLLSLASLGAQGAFPYGFTLAVALTQDLSIAQDAAALCAWLAWRVKRLRLPAPSAREIAFAAFLVYALIVPAWARVFEGHPGNEPKYLRMALAIGHRLTLDVDGIDGTLDELPVLPLSETLPRTLGTLVDETRQMARALLAGPEAFSRDAVRASRVARQTIRGKDGGIFHVLAPGPSLWLAPTLRADRALNALRGTPHRIALSLLAWNALGAALVAAVFLLLRDVTGRPGLSAALAAAFALTPPFVFYSWQFYPEMPGALVLAYALRVLLFGSGTRARDALALGLALATLPWLHQKFLPVWGILGIWAVVKAVDRVAGLRALAALVLPQALSLFLTALYNFAIAGSVRPDALFLAWGPAGITTDHIAQGFFGLLLDARYGILPYAPAYLLAAGGLLLGAPSRPLLKALPVALVYYLTVAAADDWHGAVSNLGRYFMPVAPYVIAAAGLALARAGSRPGVRAVALALFAWTGLHAAALFADPHAANEATRWLQRSALADGKVYVPDLFIRSFSEGAPGLVARLLAWATLAGALALFLRRAAAGRSGASAPRALVGLSALVLALGLVLERWPTPYGLPRWGDALELRPGVTAFFLGRVEIDRGAAFVQGRSVEILVRSRVPLRAVTLFAAGEGTLTPPERPPVALKPQGVWGSLPLAPLATLQGRRGLSETLYLQSLKLDPRGPLALRLSLPSGDSSEQ